MSTPSRPSTFSIVAGMIPWMLNLATRMLARILNLPEPLVGFERWGDTVFAAVRGEHRDVYYDTLRRPVWRGQP